jgi:hypothetical protein
MKIQHDGSVVNRDQSVTAASMFTYSSPSVTQLTLKNGPTSGGTVITFDGSNFGADPAVVSAKIGATSCTSIAISSHTRMTCTLQPGSGAGLFPSVNVDGLSVTGSSSNTEFKYDSPSIASVEPVSGRPTSGGVTITIHGSGFGTSSLNTVVSLTSRDLSSSKSCSGVIVQQFNKITCVLPVGVGTNDLKVEVSSLIGSQAFCTTRLP